MTDTTPAPKYSDYTYFDALKFELTRKFLGREVDGFKTGSKSPELPKLYTMQQTERAEYIDWIQAKYNLKKPDALAQQLSGEIEKIAPDAIRNSVSYLTDKTDLPTNAKTIHNLVDKVIKSELAQLVLASAGQEAVGKVSGALESAMYNGVNELLVKNNSDKHRAFRPNLVEKYLGEKQSAGVTF